MVLPATRSLGPAGSTFVERAHAAGVRVGTWTADEPEEVRTLLSIGVDAIASNDPATALAVLREA
jgi:glycerophosphoryl diester phosphodiesterase